jgi:hypothetical protein
MSRASVRGTGESSISTIARTLVTMTSDAL